MEASPVVINEGKGPYDDGFMEHYPICSVPKSLNVFGIGVSLYFRSAMRYSMFLFLCGVWATPAIMNNYSHQDPESTPSLLKGTVFGLSRENMGLWINGASDFLICITLLLMIYVDAKSEAHEVKQLDDSLNTTEDYSVEVMNPPVDVKDPDKYRDFFIKLGGPGAKVKAVTIALNNGDLLQKLSARRFLRCRSWNTRMSSKRSSIQNPHR